MLHKNNTLDNPLKDLLQKRALPGVLVVEITGEIVFASDEAVGFLDEISTRAKQNGNGKSTHVLPVQVLNFCREVGGRPVSPTAQSDDTDDASAPRRAMLFRSPSDQHYLIMALSFGPSTSPSGRKLVFLVVQRIGQRKSVDPARLGQRYGLTKREQEVVTRLVQGDSNKEIAASLKIQEYTVKDHLKHIMAKCQVDSRISIISKLLNL